MPGLKQKGRRSRRTRFLVGGATHGTDGPLTVSEGGFMTDLGEQFLQVARTLDPDHALKPDDTDSNDLETINVYTVSVFCLTAQLVDG